MKKQVLLSLFVTLAVLLYGLAPPSELLLAKDFEKSGKNRSAESDRSGGIPPIESERQRQFGPFSDWSEPVNLGPVVNSEFDQNLPAISRDGLSLYFQSGRPPVPAGHSNIWVSQRTSLDAPWGEPQNIGPNVNSAGATTPSLSWDGHWLYFSSLHRVEGSCGARDLWVSHREDTDDDFAWEPPVNLGCTINTKFDESFPDYFLNPETGTVILFFGSQRPGGLGGSNDIYSSEQGEDGSFGPGVLVPELNSPFFEGASSIRSDGLEIFFVSDRPGGQQEGVREIWRSTRETTLDAWSEPVNLGPIINAGGAGGPALSADGTTLFFHSGRPGGFGHGGDLYVTTRTELCDDDNDQKGNGHACNKD